MGHRMRVVKSPRLDEEEKAAKELLESSLDEQNEPINGRPKRSLQELLSLIDFPKGQTQEQDGE